MVHGNSKPPSGGPSNTATYTDTGLGQLAGVTGPNFPSSTYGAPANPFNCATSSKGYCYDRLGNLIAKEGTQFLYSTTQPHVLTQVKIGSTATGVGIDVNGNRTSMPAQGTRPAQTYQYTHENRLASITAGSAGVGLKAGDEISGPVDWIVV